MTIKGEILQLGTGNGKRLRARNLETVATRNICGIRDKQPEMVEFMQKNKICVMGLSDVRKEVNMKQTHDCYVETWSGVDKNIRVSENVMV